MSVPAWIGVALFGGLGALARVLLGVLLSRPGVGSLPVGTFAVNLTGAFALGLVSGPALTGADGELADAALIGSYTTFSTWMLETSELVERGERAAAVANIAISLAAGLAAVALGRALAGGA